jgi:hypothetical protein
VTQGTTNIGYINDRGQKVLEKTALPSNHYNQSLYMLECTHCGAVYGANGSDIWLRKCPTCQGGKPSSEARQ